MEPLETGPPLQAVFADQVVAARNHHLFVFVGEIDHEAQVGKHGLRGGARDRLAHLCRIIFGGNCQQGVKGLGVGAVAPAFGASLRVRFEDGRLDRQRRLDDIYSREPLRQGQQDGHCRHIRQPHDARKIPLQTDQQLTEMPQETDQQQQDAVPHPIRLADENDRHAQRRENQRTDLPEQIVKRQVVTEDRRLRIRDLLVPGDQAQAKRGENEHAQQGGNRVSAAVRFGEGV